MAREEKDQVYGIRPIIEALEVRKPVDKIVVMKGLKGELAAQLKGLAKKNQVPVQVVPPEFFKRFRNENHQGAMAELAPVAFYQLEDLLPEILSKQSNPLILVLDGVTDIRNFGSMIRTAECMGVHAIVFPARGSAAVNSDAVKTSAGAIFRIPLCKEKHFGSAMQLLQDNGIQLLTCTEKADSYLQQCDLSGPLALVMGAEDKGVDPRLLERADIHAGIAMAGKTSSLNVAVAVGMALFEINRQRLTSQ